MNCEENQPQSRSPKTRRAATDRRAEDADLRRLGQAWASVRDTLVLDVPSAIIPEERNVLINPRHPDASDVTVERERPFTFDPRLFE